MSTRQHLAMGFAPLLLRLMLGVTFLWAGAGKVLHEDDFSPTDSATLASMGLNLRGGGGAASGAGSTLAPASTTPTMAPPDQPIPVPAEEARPEPAAPAAPGNGAPTRPSRPMSPGRSTGSGSGPIMLGAALAQPAERGAGKTGAPGAAVGGVRAKALYHVAVLLKHAAYPSAAKASDEAPMRLWPQRLGDGAWPYYAAWAVGLTELLGGAMILAGMFTRVAALGVGMVMVGALWLTQIGPAVAAHDVVLGFLPNYKTFDVAAWMPVLWMFALLFAALALLAAGPGVLAIDNVLLRDSGGGGKSGKPAEK